MKFFIILGLTLLILFAGAIILIRQASSQPPEFDIYQNNASDFEESNQDLKL